MSFPSSISGVLLRSIVVLTLTAFPLTLALDVRGQQTQGGLDVDSMFALLDTIQRPFMTFVPSYTARMTGNVSNVGWSNRFANQSQFGLRGNLMFNLDTDRKDYRLQERFETNKTLAGRFGYMVAKNLTTMLVYTDSRQFNRVVAPVGGLQDFSLDNNSIDGSANYHTRLFRSVRFDSRVTARFLDSEQTFKHDRTATAGINGGFGYNIFGDFAAFQVRGAYVNTDASSETGTSSDNNLDNLGGYSDSVQTLVNVTVSEDVGMAFDFMNFESERDYADQARGSTGAQQPGSENVIREHESKRNRTWGVALDAELRRGIVLGVTFRETDQARSYTNNQTRDSQSITDIINADLRYTPKVGTSMSFRVENRIRTFDFGPLSLNGRDQISKSVRMSLSHKFTQTLNAELSVANSIEQSKYVRSEENPRDRDQVDTSVNLRIGSRPFTQMGINVVVTGWVTDYVNIDASLSDDNRRKEKYDLRTQMTYTISEKVNLRQDYGVAIEFTDHTFRSSDNFLDRNITFSNGLTTKMTEKTTVTIDYRLRLHDKGSYLPPDNGTERILVVQTEDRNDALDTRLEYRINPHVRAEVIHEYSNRRAENISSGRITNRSETGIEFGLIGNYNVGATGKFNFNIKKVNRAGDFVSERQKDYWIISSEFRYAF